MLVDLKRTVAYICPLCSNISSKRISVFDFSGVPKISLICPTHGCHETCVTIAPKNTKYNIGVECPLCGGKHTYTSSREAFWNKKLLTYKCPAAGMDIFFAGGRREVEKAIEDTSEAYSDALDDGWQDLADFEPWQEEEYSTLYSIVDRLYTLKAQHSLSCRCGGENIEIGIAGEGVILQCPKCKTSKVIEATNDNFTRLLNTSHFIIGN